MLLEYGGKLFQSFAVGADNHDLRHDQSLFLAAFRNRKSRPNLEDRSGNCAAGHCGISNRITLWAQGRCPRLLFGYGIVASAEHRMVRAGHGHLFLGRDEVLGKTTHFWLCRLHSPSTVSILRTDKLLPPVARLAIGIIVFVAVYLIMLLYAMGQEAFYINLVRGLRSVPAEEQSLALVE